MIRIGNTKLFVAMHIVLIFLYHLVFLWTMDSYKSAAGSSGLHLNWPLAQLAFVFAFIIGISTKSVYAIKARLIADDERVRTSAVIISRHDALLAAKNEDFVLEIRNADLGVQKWEGHQLWRKINETDSNRKSFLENEDPADAYGTLTEDHALDSDLMSGAVFRSAAGFAVEYWPVPTFISGPPQHADLTARPAGRISDGRRKATLGATLFLWQDDEMSLSSQAIIERVFAYFDDNPQVPAAMLLVSDGDYERMAGCKPGGGGLPALMPPTSVLGSNAGLLVTRSDRVDRYLRPFVNTREGDVKLRDKAAVGTRFWQYYWKKNNGAEDDSFGAYFRKHLDPRDSHDIAPTMSSTWWHTQLPAFWSSIGEQGDFKPTRTLPIRWTAAQLKRFDDAPLVGYLHRPVKIALRDNDGVDLTGNDLTAAVADGWRRAAGSLAQGNKPKRIFYDSNGKPAWTATLAAAMEKASLSLALDDDAVGYDVHQRIGDMGAVSALSQIVLAAMAGHADGKVSATINLGVDGRADILIVTPPDETQRNENLDGPHADEVFGSTV